MQKEVISNEYKTNTVLYKILKPLIFLLVKILYNPKIVGKENLLKEEGYIVASNHVHAFDPVIIIYSNKRIIHFLAKKELYKGILKQFFLSFGTIPVDRKNKNPKAVNLSIEFLKNNEVIGIFPEGTRNKTKELLLEFKYGAVKMANAANKKIIPCAISGSYNLFKRNLTITYGDPIDTTDLTLEEANKLLRENIEKLLYKEN